ncbi:MAG: AMMECR1 domain-containing protein [Ignavibacteriota bacterium]
MKYPFASVSEELGVPALIFILSEFVPIKSYDEIIIGTHGLYLDEGSGGLLLPQVATEHKMDSEQFLSALCNKSGFYRDYWKEKMLKIKIFTAEIFSEIETDK